MSDIQQRNALKAVRVRSEQLRSKGQEGFVSVDVLRFDVGLNTRTLRRLLDAAVAAGDLERKTSTRRDGVNRNHQYRAVCMG